MEAGITVEWFRIEWREGSDSLSLFLTVLHWEVSGKQLHLLGITGSCAQGKSLPTKGIA